MSKRRLLSYNDIHGGARYWVEPRSADVQRGVGRGVFPKEGELATACGYVLDLIRHGALLPFDGPPDAERAEPVAPTPQPDAEPLPTRDPPPAVPAEAATARPAAARTSKSAKPEGKE